MKSHIQFGASRIDFDLEFCERKTLGITVTPDLNILVKAPEGVSVEKIHEKLKKKAPWIIKQKSFFLSFVPRTPPRRYVSGETHLYLGRQYRLKIEKSDEGGVKLKGHFLLVSTSDASNAKRLVNDWYLRKAKDKFHSTARPLIERFKKYEVEPDAFVVREMHLRWGSCTPTGKIILNPELIKAPTACIEYVIVHELCHLVYHDHSRKFIELQSKEMPDWQKWKTKLERLLA